MHNADGKIMLDCTRASLQANLLTGLPARLPVVYTQHDCICMPRILLINNKNMNYRFRLFWLCVILIVVIIITYVVLFA